MRGPRERRAWRRDILEVALLIVVFATVEPLLAIGLYFCFWHSTRHIARLILIDPQGRQALADVLPRRWVVSFVMLHRSAWLLCCWAARWAR